MKIKTKKQLTLPQLIEWLLKSGYRNYTANSNMGNIVTLSRYGAIQFSHGTFFPEETFTVEVEEEITEDTVFPKLVERWKHDGEGDEAFRYVGHDDKSINRVLFANPESVETTHFYIENDNQELVLIWRDGKLI